MIEVKQISKSFKTHQVLKDVTFSVTKGEIVGFLGRNGAGKTTMMRIMSVFLEPSTGSVMIDGLNVQHNAIEAHTKIGYLPENPPLYPSMTVRDYLNLAAVLRNVPGNKLKRAIDEVTEQCQLSDVIDKQIGILSKMTHSNDTGPGSDAEAHILPLLGRRTYNRSNKWVYYTATDKYNQVRIPISHNGRDCGGEYGCDEIMNGETITIPELNGSFKVKIYENTSLHYIPY